MATPTGTISFSDLRTETGLSGPVSLGDGPVQDLIGRTQRVDMATARGKTSNFTITFTEQIGPAITLTDTARSLFGWPGTGNLTVIIQSTATANTIYTGTNPWGAISIINYGNIIGPGGAGGSGASGDLDSNAFALIAYGWSSGNGGNYGLFNYTPSTNRIQRQHILYNYGMIAGGGGGGGGGCCAGWGRRGDADAAGGGGGGGGQGNGGQPAPGGAGGVGRITGGGGNGYNGGAGGAGSQDGAGGGGGGAGDRFGKHTGDGGGGGALGAGGAQGGDNTAGWGYFGYGGAAGVALYNYANMDVQVQGTIIGPII